MDPELAVDIQNGLGDNSTDIELELGNDGAMIASSFEEVSCLGQNDEMTHESSRGGGTVVEGDEPYVGQEFESEEAAHAFYSAYSMRFGFITRINYLSRSKLDGSVIGRTIVCNKEGYRKAYRCDINKKNIKPRTPTRVGCKAMLSVRKLSTGKWVVTKFVKEHTHALTAVNSQNCSIINQIPNENMKIQELTQQLLLERERSASLRKTIDLLFNHIEEHTQDLSKTVQYIADKWSLYSLTNSPKTNEIRLMEVQYVVKQCCHSRHKHVLSRFSKKKKKKSMCSAFKDFNDQISEKAYEPL